MSLDTFQRRRAGAVLTVVGIVALVCLATGNAVAAVVLIVLAPALVYRVTGHRWSQAFPASSGREPEPTHDLPPRSDRRPAPGPQQRVAAIAMLVAVVPAVIGLLSALAGRLAGFDDPVLPIVIVMTLAWTGFATLLSGLVSDEGGRAPIALSAGAATALSMLVWAGVVL
ncbi:MAG: hypothetical protein QOI73_2744 [Solirubrobacteraceae bacterium]|nr:hypothetical protein [Solirubrobacteraceae bacterium]